MMRKWGKQKALSNTAPASHPSLINHIFPSSWFSRFKQSSDCTPATGRTKGQLGSPSLISSPGIHARVGRFSAEDDSYWRLSFGDEQAGNMQMFGREKSRKLHDMVCKPVQTRITQSKAGFSQENSASRRQKVREVAELKRERRNSVKVQSFEILGTTTLEEKHGGQELHEEDEIITQAVEKLTSEMQPEKTIQHEEAFYWKIASDPQTQCSFSSPDSKLRPTVEDYTLQAMNLEETRKEADQELEMSLEGECLKAKKDAETKSRNEQQRNSIYTTRDCQRKRRKMAGRIKSYSPRTAAKAEFKIKALEDMKKVKIMRKKRNERESAAGETERSGIRNTTKEVSVGDITTLDSYALIKNSLNPGQDFRESMIEMILEKDIERPEELEELLACYLTLNDDVCHDLIVKVFREVWVELTEWCLASKVEGDLFDFY